MRTTNDLFWEIVKSDFSWLMREKGTDEDDDFYDEKIKNSAKVLLCNSFFDLFVSPFSKIQLFRYRSNVKFEVGESWEKDTYRYYEVDLLNKPNYLGGNIFGKMEFSENLNCLAFYNILLKRGTPSQYITTNKGNAFLIENDYLAEDELKSDGFNFDYYTLGAIGSKKIIKFIFIQFETRSYGLLPLINTLEKEFNSKKHYFSFAVNYFNDYVHEGDIYFYGFVGLEYSKKNVIEIINMHLKRNTFSDRPKDFSYNTSYDILEFSHQFNEYRIRTRITFFKETEFIYTVRVSETINAGRLREEWVGVTARINFYNDEILEFNGSKSLESLK